MVKIVVDTQPICAPLGSIIKPACLGQRKQFRPYEMHLLQQHRLLKSHLKQASFQSRVFSSRGYLEKRYLG
jgi:hypothetical protein